MSGYFQAFELDELEKKQAEAGAGRITSSCGAAACRSVSTSLPAGGQDPQHPHASDEVYFVLRGRATLRVGDQDHEVRQGSVVSVDHGEEHDFVDIAEDLHLLVVFAPPEIPED